MMFRSSARKLVLLSRGIDRISVCSRTRWYQTTAKPVFGYNPDNWKVKTREEIPEPTLSARAEHSNVYRYVSAFRSHGHRYATLNPVPYTSPQPLGPELEATRYRLNSEMMVPTAGLVNSSKEMVTVGELGEMLANMYCGNIALETSSIEQEDEAEWLHRRYEELICTQLKEDEKLELAEHMLRSQTFDQFLATKFQSVKRYGGEGAESMMAFFSELLSGVTKCQVGHVVVGQAHRGRLNLLTGMLSYPPVVMFRKMRGLAEFPPDQAGAGDVLSHFSTSLEVRPGVKLTLLPNPSHLEAVNPVACGKVRAQHLSNGEGDYSSSGKMGDTSLCVQVHGDAALAGQGINMETLQIANLAHYSVGGSIHLVVNNQVGFTTPPDRARSSSHCTGLASQIGAPVIHVNGDLPENVVRATRLALEYQQKFRKDVFVDLVCYRRWGHNELDDPTFTNPAQYSVIQARSSVPDNYAKRLEEEGVLSTNQKAKTISDHMEMLNQQYNLIDSYQPQRTNLKAQWSDITEPTSQVTDWGTGLDSQLLRWVGAASVKITPGFSIHSHLAKHHVEGRLKKLESGSGLDWGTAEALAIGSLLYQGFNVRISGQDVGRATFSHRHAMLVDQDTNETIIPLNNMVEGQSGHLEVANSPLSEEAVLGFEYGMSIDSPNNLVIWEAQFGDFFNGAQIILDTFLANGESKWGLQSGLVLLLPHGMDGAGPEHSSCRLERFLQMTDSKEAEGDGDNVNWEVVNPTTASQYFHLLRRQMVRNYRKPLVVVAPKTLLRLPAASASLSDMGPDSSFQSVLADSNSQPDKVETVVFVSGKHYYTLARQVEEKGMKGSVALVRLESLCPFPLGRLQEEISKYKNTKRWVWSQEEHRNQGAWSFIRPRFQNLLDVKLDYAGRSELCQPAVGVGKVHHAEVESIFKQTFGDSS